MYLPSFLNMVICIIYTCWFTCLYEEQLLGHDFMLIAKQAMQVGLSQADKLNIMKWLWLLSAAIAMDGLIHLIV